MLKTLCEKVWSGVLISRSHALEKWKQIPRIIPCFTATEASWLGSFCAARLEMKDPTTQGPLVADYPTATATYWWLWTKMDVTGLERWKIFKFYGSKICAWLDWARFERLRCSKGHTCIKRFTAEVCPLIYGANLVALSKKDGGIRPIAGGNTIRRLTSKIVSLKSANDGVWKFETISAGLRSCGWGRGSRAYRRTVYKYRYIWNSAFAEVRFQELLQHDSPKQVVTRCRSKLARIRFLPRPMLAPAVSFNVWGAHHTFRIWGPVGQPTWSSCFLSSDSTACCFLTVCV